MLRRENLSFRALCLRILTFRALRRENIPRRFAISKENLSFLALLHRNLSLRDLHRGDLTIRMLPPDDLSFGAMGIFFRKIRDI